MNKINYLLNIIAYLFFIWYNMYRGDIFENDTKQNQHHEKNRTNIWKW